MNLNHVELLHGNIDCLASTEISKTVRQLIEEDHIVNLYVSCSKSYTPQPDGSLLIVGVCTFKKRKFKYTAIIQDSELFSLKTKEVY